MNQRTFVASIFLLLVFGISESVYSQCTRSGWGEYVAIPVVYAFQEDEVRTDWSYNSLRPRLQLPKQFLAETPKSSRIVSGELHATFCVEAQKIPSPDSKIYFLFGPRKLEAAVRPIQWREIELQTSPRQTIRQGSMPQISFLHQPSPDWLAIRKASWLVNERGERRLEIELYNFGSRPHPGATLFYSALRPAGVCFGPKESTFANVSVIMRIEKGKVEVLSADPQSSELIKRRGSIEEQCGTKLTVELSPTGAIEGNGTLRIRYDLREIKSKKLTFGFDEFMDRRYVFIEGERVYPQQVSVQ